MTLSEQRQLLVESLKRREYKNTYTQDSKLRLNVYENPRGYGDCSSTMFTTYKMISGINIGSYSSSQAQNKLGIIVDVAKSELPDESNLLPGDLIFFNYEKAKQNSSNWGTWKDRYLHVGHVEMYIGDGKTIGHPSGFGPRIIDMRTYCNRMFKSGETYSISKRFVFNVNSYDAKFTGIESGFYSWCMNLQNEIKVKVDGIPGPEVLSKVPLIKFGTKGKVVELVQQRLIDLGYDIGKYGKNKDGIDGIYGLKCQEAIKSIDQWVLLKNVGTDITVGTDEWKFLLNIA
ncbi:C40 family peptidase [Lachnoclostridium phytofermentans]|uniref:NLP/P60 protein n=1 Tax=Lachnoclostridium phytofermentans (strain ATCC 700394 / DSM 18823 / ISDg) TaxID=357809 RepID=A9KP39_LACP7|nr:NlpC/P60 family protein [Lachnoclostridium phytofermentans]ABX43209.1 NLP/P60 protein [Lachnoclostridium phytofermentans ISDg]